MCGCVCCGKVISRVTYVNIIHISEYSKETSSVRQSLEVPVSRLTRTITHPFDQLSNLFAGMLDGWTPTVRYMYQEPDKPPAFCTFHFLRLASTNAQSTALDQLP